MPEFMGWPEIPKEDRPRLLYYSGFVDPQDLAALASAGWDPVDVRLLPSGTMGERSKAVLAWLEGVRLGSIEPDPKAAKFIELEMRACGLHVGKAPTSDAEKKITTKDLQDILDLGKGKGEWQGKT